MRLVIQRVKSSQVTVDNECIGKINTGLTVLVGVTHEDNEKAAEFLADKCVNLRIFEDEAGLMNRSLLDIGGEVLAISQFTLYGDASHGRRPSFSLAARPEPAEKLYNHFVNEVTKRGIKVATGRFGAEMQVEIHNDGPVTIIVDSR